MRTHFPSGDLAVAQNRMLKFVTLSKEMPQKRDATARAQDFDEIYREFAAAKAAEQAGRCSQCGVPFCQSHCPLHNNIPDWLRMTAEGRLREAYELSQSTNTFPEICGRICPQDRLCEGNCVIEQSGHGTVTIGAIEKYITDSAWDNGWILPARPLQERGESVAIIGAGPGGLAARVRAIHAQNRAAERGQAGDRCALNLAGERITKDAIARGDVVIDPALQAPASRIDATLQVLASETRPVGQWMPVRLHHAALEVGARVVLLGDDPVPPGGEAFVQLVLDKPVAAAVGDRFVLRDTTAQRTIGGGSFVDLRAPARKRRTPERLAQLAAGALPDPEKSLSALLEASGYLDFGAFVRDRALSDAERETLIQHLSLLRLPTAKGEFVVAPAAWLRLKTAIHATLTTFHADYPNLPGMGLERLRLQLQPRLPAPVFAALLQGLARHKEISLDGAWIRLPGHEVRLSPADEALWGKVGHYIGGEGRFRPPRVRDIAGYTGIAEPEVRRVFKLMGRMGKVDEVAHDHFFLRGTVAEIVQIMASIAAGVDGGRFTAAQLRDQLDNGRKVAIQILEFFDRHGVTIRHGDLRRVNRHRLDLFGKVPDDLPASDKVAKIETNGRASFPVGRPDFKSGKGCETVLGGFDSHSLPPNPLPPKLGVR